MRRLRVWMAFQVARFLWWFAPKPKLFLFQCDGKDWAARSPGPDVKYGFVPPGPDNIVLIPDGSAKPDGLPRGNDLMCGVDEDEGS